MSFWRACLLPGIFLARSPLGCILYTILPFRAKCDKLGFIHTQTLWLWLSNNPLQQNYWPFLMMMISKFSSGQGPYMPEIKPASLRNGTLCSTLLIYNDWLEEHSHIYQVLHFLPYFLSSHCTRPFLYIKTGTVKGITLHLVRNFIQNKFEKFRGHTKNLFCSSTCEDPKVSKQQVVSHTVLSAHWCGADKRQNCYLNTELWVFFV